MTRPSIVKIRVLDETHYAIVSDDLDSGHTLCDRYEWFYVETFAMTEGVAVTEDRVTCMSCIVEEAEGPCVPYFKTVDT